MPLLLVGETLHVEGWGILSHFFRQVRSCVPRVSKLLHVGPLLGLVASVILSERVKLRLRNVVQHGEQVHVEFG